MSPANALDLAAQRELREMLRKVAARTGILMVTHHLADILPEIERVVLMREGRIVGDGPKREMLRPHRLRELFGIELGIDGTGGLLAFVVSALRSHQSFHLDVGPGAVLIYGYTGKEG